MFTGIHHIGYYVADLEGTIERYRELYGGEVELQFRNEAAKANVAFVKSGETRVELMQPDDRSLLGGSSGQVLHHVGYLVPDIEKAMAELRAKGVRFLAEKPTENPLGWKIIYFDGGPLLGTQQHLAQY